MQVTSSDRQRGRGFPGPSRGAARGTARVGFVLLLVLGVAASASAAEASSGPACPSADVPATAFTDTVRSTHRAAIDCLAWWGLTEGRSPTRYGATERVTRGQTAAMIARLLDRTDRAAEPDTSGGFADTVGHRFAPEIDLLADLGIIQGRTASTFEPDGATTRAQMATIVTRTLDSAYDLSLPQGPVPFTDVAGDDPHRANIGRLVAAGVVTGTGSTTFHPHRVVTRDQMASFLTRAVSLLVDAELAALPEERPAEDDPYASAVRGTWVHLFDDTLKSARSIRAMVDELAAAEVNTVVVQVARRHDAYYDSEVLPATLDPRLEPGLDVLAELIPRAHARGIEVHAWFGVAPSWHGVYADLGIRPDQLGADVAWRTRTVDGTRSDYLDPAVPAVQQHVVDVVAELAADYPLDGIHLDYVRYQSNRHGYHPEALARFRAETGATGTPAPTDPVWSDWRRAQTRRVFGLAREAVRSQDAGIELSAATISWGDGPPTPDRAGFRATRSYRDVLQDWDRLVREDRIDTVMPMNYYRDHDRTQAAGFQRWLRYERALAREHEPRVVPGLAGYLNHPAAGVRQVHAAMQQTDGAMVYSYQQPTLDNSRGIWAELARTRWGYAPTAP